MKEYALDDIYGSDYEAEELLVENSDNQIDSYISSFKKEIPRFKRELEELDALRKEFVSDYSIQRILSLTKEEYVVGLGTKDSFCYRLETGLQNLGNIHGATARKFGLYYGTSGNDNTQKFRVTRKFGSDADKALEKIKDQIIKLIKAGEIKDYAAIHECDFGPLFRGKILSTYYPNDYLAIYSDEHLDYFLTRLGISFLPDEDIIDKQQKLINWKNAQKDLQGLDLNMFGRFLYFSFGRPLDDEKDERDYQKVRDSEYPKEYATRIGITIDQWKNLLQDPEVFLEKDLELVKRIYKADNHASTCYDLGAQDGLSPSTYIKPVVALARRVSDKAGIDPIFRNNGKQVWWRVLFWGRYREDSHFEWKLQPKLAKAIQLLYPDLDDDEINNSEDQKLIDDLKQATLQASKNGFEYVGKAKQKAPAIFTNGHKTYPRDRQTAINALVHAHYLCEIDGNHPTFIRKNSDKNYTEPHHLIPMSESDKYSVSLDVEENIVSLCSNCHNQIHYGRDAAELIKMLYNSRKSALESVGLHISLKQLLKMYDVLDE